MSILTTRQQSGAGGRPRHARPGAPGERANPQLKTRHILRQLRCRPWRAGQLVKAIHVLQTAKSEDEKGSVNGTLKVELVHRTVYSTRNKARQDIARWIELRYNQTLLHSRLGYRTPQEVMDEFLKGQEAA